ncbi:hypothetical protein [Bradyrhizobium sp.]|nr:hypothetical protein [Bradyrhizobium sp.]
MEISVGVKYRFATGFHVVAPSRHYHRRQQLLRERSDVDATALKQSV